jgi:glycosyltransferase involved in cell wall biosynthesis
MRFVFWQDQVSMHQAAWIRAVAERGHECIWLVDRVADPGRLTSGWQTPEVGAVDVRANPDERTMRSILAEAPERSVHVINGFRGCRTAAFAWSCPARRGQRLGVTAEGVDLRGWPGVLRRAYYRWLGARRGREIDFLLAMGQNGVRGYARSGFPKDRLFPFAYVVDRGDGPAAAEPRGDSRFRFVYVGGLHPRKGPDLLLRALGQLGRSDWRLRVVGDGPMRGGLEQLTRKLGLVERVEFLGFRAHGETLSLLATSDLVVVPSRFDGWGVAVNEALASGVPTVCSDRCGSSALLDESWRGEVFPAGEVSVLAAVLGRRLAAGAPEDAPRRRIREWADCIQGPAVAEYFLQVIEHVYGGVPRPTPPWCPRSAGPQSVAASALPLPID